MSDSFFDIQPDPKARRIFEVIATSDVRFKHATRQTLFRMGKIFRDDALFATKRGARSGVPYRYGRGFLQASAPGEPPQRRSGFLRKNIVFDVQGTQVLHFADDAYYASFLEEGTRPMKPRPFLMPSINKYGYLFPVIGQQEMDKALRPNS